MEQPTDRPTPEGIGNTTPGEGLRAYLVPGLADKHGDVRTEGTPAELSALLADLAARLALIDPASLPAGSGLSMIVSIQPDAPTGDDTDATRAAIVDAAAAVILPGVGARREAAGKSVLYSADARTAAGLGVTVFTGVRPTDVERAALDAEEIARVEPRAERGARVRFLREAADAGHVPTMLPEGDDDAARLFVITCSCNDYAQAPLGNREARAAWRQHAAARLTGQASRRTTEGLRLDADAAAAGHVASVEPAGKMDAPGLVAAVCSCGDYRSSPGTEAMGRASWRTHAAVRLAQATGGASS